MKLSAQQEYGLRCMVHMARQSVGDSVNIETIAEHESLTPAYVAKLMRILRNEGLIVSIRGQHGGYKLARPAGDVTVQEILLALGDRLFGDSFCVRHSGNSESCTHSNDCALRALWSGLDHVVETFLRSCRLSDLIRPEDSLGAWLGDHVQRLPNVVELPRSQERGSTPRGETSTPAAETSATEVRSPTVTEAPQHEVPSAEH